MKIKRRFEKIHADFEIIPFVDVLFQLVLLFFVSTAFLSTPVDKSGVHISLSSEQSVNTGIFVVLGGDDSITVNGKSVALDALENLFMSYPVPEVDRAGFPVTVETLSVPSEGIFVKIFEVLETSGFTNVNLIAASNSISE